MKVIIKGFRCHLDAEYEFRDGALILLAGPSGSGKSTVFQAIYWCLYGSVRGIYNNSGEPNKCSVILDFPSFIIYRQGRPNLLKFSHKVHPFVTYEDAVAQQLICQQFGRKEIWKACCYIEQGSRCSLLSGSNSDRMELLNNLSFATDDPEACISRIDFELKSVQKQFHTLQVKFETECEIFSKELGVKPVNPEAIRSIGCLSELKISLPRLQQELNSLAKTQLEQHQLKGSHQTLTLNIKNKTQTLENMRRPDIDKEVNAIMIHKMSEPHEDSFILNVLFSIGTLRQMLESAIKIGQEFNTKKIEQQKIKVSYQILTESLSEKTKQLEKNPIIEQSEIENLRSQVEGMQIQYSAVQGKQEYLQKQQGAHEKLDNATKVLDTHHDDWKLHCETRFTQHDVWVASEQEKGFTENSSISNQLNVLYNEKSIQEKISFHRSSIEETSKIDSRLNILSKIRELENKLDPIRESKTTEDEVNLAKDKYNKLKQGVDLLQCPHCRGSVRYTNGLLVPGDQEPVPPSQIEEALKNVTKLFNEWNNTKDADLIRSQLLDLFPLCGNREEIEKLSVECRPSIREHQDMIDRLTSIKFIVIPTTSSAMIQRLVAFHDCQDNFKSLSSQLSPPKTDLNSIHSEIQRARQELDRLTNDLYNQKQLIESINSLKTQIKNISLEPDIDQRCIDKEREIRKLDEYLKYCEEVNRLQVQILSIQKEIDEIILIPDIDDLHQRKSEELAISTQMVLDVEYADKMTRRQGELEKGKKDVTDMHQRLIDLQKLRQSAVDVECQQLQTTVDSINQAMAEVLSLIFDAPITVILRLYKQLKTDKRIKPSVNMTIHYRGAEYDSVNSMSGGEGDRISLALILSLNRVSTSPILMLDESMSSLNATLRELSLSSLRASVCGTKTILCVNHEDVEGLYDNVIRF